MMYETLQLPDIRHHTDTVNWALTITYKTVEIHTRLCMDKECINGGSMCRLRYVKSKAKSNKRDQDGRLKSSTDMSPHVNLYHT